MTKVFTAVFSSLDYSRNNTGELFKNKKKKKRGISPLDGRGIMSMLPSLSESDFTQISSSTKFEASLDEKGSSLSTDLSE